MQAEQLSRLDGKKLNAAFLFADPSDGGVVHQDWGIVWSQGEPEREVIVDRQMAGPFDPTTVDRQVQ